jgi:hypothetical protein
VQKQKHLSQGLPGDPGELQLMEGHLSYPNAGEASGALVSKDDDLEAVREELIKVDSYS